MGARLIPIVRNLAVKREVFTVGSRDVRAGCVPPGPHRLLRFDALCHNAGDTDLVVGSPTLRPELFTYSSEDRRYYLPDFVRVVLETDTGALIRESQKRAFCLIDLERIEARGRATPQFTDCNANQGVSAGWADVYPAHLPCQYVVIDDVPDGNYRLRLEIDVQRVLPGGPAASLTAALHLEGDTVVVMGLERGPDDPVGDEPPAPPPPPIEPAPAPAPPVFDSPLEAFARAVIDTADPGAASRYLAPGFVGHGVIVGEREDRAIDAATYRARLGALFTSFAGFKTRFELRLTDGDWIAASWTRTALQVAPYLDSPAQQRRIELRGVTIARVERGQIAEQWDVVAGGWLALIGGATVNALEPLE